MSIRERLKSRRVQTVEEPPQPTPSAFDQVGGWAEPDPANVPNEGDQRRAGAAALANVVRPQPPTYATHSVKG